MFLWKIQNHGTLVDRLGLRGPGSSPGFKVAYFFGAINVTKATVAGTYVKSLAAGANLRIAVKITVASKARVGSVQLLRLRAASGRGPLQTPYWRGSEWFARRSFRTEMFCFHPGKA